MKCIPLFKEQMSPQKYKNTGAGVAYEDFLEAYYDLFTKFNLQDLSKHRLGEIFAENSSKLKREDPEGMVTFALQLEKAVNRLSGKIQHTLNIKKLPDTVFFIGDGTIDGHGLIINDTPYGIFELSTLKEGLKQYRADVFLTHELLHPLHYQQNGEYFPRNWKSPEEYYFKRMFSEGLATYFSKEILKIPVNDAYWFGFLEEEALQKWMNYCEKEKAVIGNKLKKSLEDQRLNSALYRQLFSIEGFENLTEYRLAYYYGCGIIKSIHQDFGYHKILTMKYEDARDHIFKYFEMEG